VKRYVWEWDLVITAVYWSLWLTQNRKVFDDIELPAVVVAKDCIDMVKLWSYRAKRKELEAAKKNLKKLQTVEVLPIH
jgi:hypothetical protein